MRKLRLHSELDSKQGGELGRKSMNLNFFAIPWRFTFYFVVALLAQRVYKDPFTRFQLTNHLRTSIHASTLLATIVNEMQMIFDLAFVRALSLICGWGKWSRLAG
jgi:hypothetical protein